MADKYRNRQKESHNLHINHVYFVNQAKKEMKRAVRD